MKRLREADKELHDHLKKIAQIDPTVNPKVRYFPSTLDINKKQKMLTEKVMACTKEEVLHLFYVIHDVSFLVLIDTLSLCRIFN